MDRDVDQIIERVKQQIPAVEIEQLKVAHPGADDDGVWWFRLPGIVKNIQIESSDGVCPFIVEDSDMNSSSDAQTVRTIEEAVELVVAYLSGLESRAD